VVPFFWLCGRFMFIEYKKIPGTYRAGTIVLRRNHTGTKTPKTSSDMLVQFRAASRASAHFNQPKSLLASARFIIPMLMCSIPAKLYARIAKHASSEQTWRRHINPCQPCVLEPGRSGLKVLMHPQKTLIQIRFSHERSRNVPLRGCVHLFYRGRDGMLGGEPPARSFVN
jgi:hypothetical protein